MNNVVHKLKTCAGCWWLDHADSDGIICIESGRCSVSLRCVLYETEQDHLLTSDKVLESILQDILFMEVL